MYWAAAGIFLNIFSFLFNIKYYIYNILKITIKFYLTHGLTHARPRPYMALHGLDSLRQTYALQKSRNAHLKNWANVSKIGLMLIVANLGSTQRDRAKPYFQPCKETLKNARRNFSG